MILWNVLCYSSNLSILRDSFFKKETIESFSVNKPPSGNALTAGAFNSELSTLKEDIEQLRKSQNKLMERYKRDMTTVKDMLTQIVANQTALMLPGGMYANLVYCLGPFWVRESESERERSVDIFNKYSCFEKCKNVLFLLFFLTLWVYFFVLYVSFIEIVNLFWDLKTVPKHGIWKVKVILLFFVFFICFHIAVDVVGLYWCCYLLWSWVGVFYINFVPEFAVFVTACLVCVVTVNFGSLCIVLLYQVFICNASY